MSLGLCHSYGRSCWFLASFAWSVSSLCVHMCMCGRVSVWISSLRFVHLTVLSIPLKLDLPADPPRPTSRSPLLCLSPSLLSNCFGMTGLSSWRRLHQSTKHNLCSCALHCHLYLKEVKRIVHYNRTRIYRFHHSCLIPEVPVSFNECVVLSQFSLLPCHPRCRAHFTRCGILGWCLFPHLMVALPWKGIQFP